jgi:hypothetical protein
MNDVQSSSSRPKRFPAVRDISGRASSPKTRIRQITPRPPQLPSRNIFDRRNVSSRSLVTLLPPGIYFVLAYSPMHLGLGGLRCFFRLWHPEMICGVASSRPATSRDAPAQHEHDNGSLRTRSTILPSRSSIRRIILSYMTVLDSRTLLGQIPAHHVSPLR